MAIPHASPPVEDTKEGSEEPLPNVADSPPLVTAEDEHVTETGRRQYCPFCGNQVDEHSAVCPSCRKVLGAQSAQDRYYDPFTPIDWTLATIFAPVGFVLGFVSLASGRRKGLHMIGISTASIFILWLISVVMGWLR